MSRSRRRRWSFALAGLALLLLSAEVCGRLYWWSRGAPFLTAPSQLECVFYPRLRRLEAMAALPDDRTHVLLLGASVLHPQYGSVEAQLREVLELRLRRPVELHNLSEPGHSSLDSLEKLRHVAHLGFDALLFYHAINEIRANNCPRDLFRSDYRHYAWYAELADAERWSNPLTVLPFTAAFAYDNLGARLGWIDVVPADSPRPQWLAAPNDEVRTAAPFEHNLRAIVELAEAHGTAALVGTYAIHVPADYELDAFVHHELDYDLHELPIEVWGEQHFVARGVEAHNEIVRRLAAEDPRVQLVDFAREMPRGAPFFNDPCHLTHRGSTRFAEITATALARALR